jgi:hypothetical protein
MDFPLDKFRALYPQFASLSDEVINAWAEQAACFLSFNNCGCEDANFMLMTAHLLAVNGLLSGGQIDNTSAGNISSATIGSVSVAYATPPTGDQFTFWLNGSPYGKQLLALLARCRTGFYVGGSPVRGSFTRGCGYYSRYR